MPMIDSDLLKTEMENFEAARLAWRATVDALPKETGATDAQEWMRLDRATNLARVEMDGQAWLVACKLSALISWAERERAAQEAATRYE
ncbi:hypothetical protein PS874_06292 [Pseudomonas fluorescens]|nr:hypothetical protein PS874_06292 [Pseudomonas fluorescens]